MGNRCSQTHAIDNTPLEMIHDIPELVLIEDGFKVRWWDGKEYKTKEFLCSKEVNEYTARRQALTYIKEHFTYEYIDKTFISYNRNTNENKDLDYFFKNFLCKSF